MKGFAIITPLFAVFFRVAFFASAQTAPARQPASGEMGIRLPRRGGNTPANRDGCVGSRLARNAE